MKLGAVLTILLSLGCATIPVKSGPCETRCGLSAPGDCEELQKVEDAVVKRLGRTVGLSPGAVCKSLSGWKVQVHERRLRDDLMCNKARGGWYQSAAVGCVIGYTYNATKTVELPDTKYRTNSLAHEIVHVADFFRVGEAGHCKWKERGVLAALLELTGEEDTTQPGIECEVAPRPASSERR